MSQMVTVSKAYLDALEELYTRTEGISTLYKGAISYYGASTELIDITATRWRIQKALYDAHETDVTDSEGVALLKEIRDELREMRERAKTNGEG